MTGERYTSSTAPRASAPLASGEYVRGSPDTLSIDTTADRAAEASESVALVGEVRLRRGQQRIELLQRCLLVGQEQRLRALLHRLGDETLEACLRLCALPFHIGERLLGLVELLRELVALGLVLGI